MRQTDIHWPQRFRFPRNFRGYYDPQYRDLLLQAAETTGAPVVLKDEVNDLGPRIAVYTTDITVNLTPFGREFRRLKAEWKSSQEEPAP